MTPNRTKARAQSPQLRDNPRSRATFPWVSAIALRSSKGGKSEGRRVKGRL